eukprot:EG_transcript_15195
MYATVARADRAHRGNGVWSAAAAEGRLATGSIDGSLHLWRLEGQEMVISHSQSHALAVVSLSLAAEVLAASLMDGSVLISRADTGDVLDCIDLDPGTAGQVAVRGDGEFVAIAAGAQGVLLYHVPSRTRHFLSCAVSEEEASCVTGACRCVAFDWDGAWLIAGCGDGTVHVWSFIEAGGGLVDPQGPALHGRWRSDFSAVADLAVSGDGRLLAVAHASGLVLLWTLPLLELYGHLVSSVSAEAPKKGALQQPPAPRCLAFAPDALFLAVGFDDGKVRLYHAGRRELAYTFSEHIRPVQQLLFLPGTDRLLSAGDDGALVTYACRFPETTPGKAADRR